MAHQMTDTDLIEFYRLKACDGDAQAAIAFAAIWQACLIQHYGRALIDALEAQDARAEVTI